MSKDLDARNLFAITVGCDAVLALVKRGLHCLSIGKSEERSRSQWQGALKDILMFCTMHCTAICGVGAGDSAEYGHSGAQLVKIVVEAYKPYMTEEQASELSMCFSAQGLNPTALGF